MYIKTSDVKILHLNFEFCFFTTMNFLTIFTVSLISIFGQLNAEFDNCPACPDVDEVVYLPSSSKCADYFVCEHGVPIRKTCPEGLHWDDSAKVCNWPDQISPPCTGKI